MQKRFTNPPDRHLFNAKVWEVVQSIPPGKVATYGQVAVIVLKSLGVDDPKSRAYGPRWVGGSLAACPEGIPWQRVINSQGKISIRGGNENEQRSILEAEGIDFDPLGRVNLNEFQWNGDCCR